MSTVLIIEDEINIRTMIKIALSVEGYTCLEASTVRDGIHIAISSLPDIIVLDLGLPDGDGQRILKRVRETSKVPILVLSARHSETDKVQLLMAGANDYVHKPFSVKELIARISVLLRDLTPIISEAKPLRQVAGLSIDINSNTVQAYGKKVLLTPKEFQLLDILTREPGVFVSQQRILRSIWGVHRSEDSHYVRILISHLRKKIQVATKPSFIIETAAGQGYRINCHPSE